MKSYQRSRNLFDPNSKNTYRLSRSRLENFFNCPRCFYLDRRLGIEPPPMPSFTLNSAVDELLKREFDVFRRLKQPHPWFKTHGIDAVPFLHPMLDDWRDVFKGVQFLHRNTNLLIFGAIDDLWIDGQGELIVVDYKATSTNQTISLDSEYRQAYKRQMEIYQWLLRRQNLKISNTGYFVYCNADKTKNAFNSRLEFTVDFIAYVGSDEWVEEMIVSAHDCLKSDTIPQRSLQCAFCNYRQVSSLLENKQDLANSSHPPSSVSGNKNLDKEVFLKPSASFSSHKRKHSPFSKSELQDELFKF